MKILTFSGSSRKDSSNLKLIRQTNNILQGKNIVFTHINLAEFNLPIYDGDLEQNNGLPENAGKLQEILSQHTALIISSPEYNGSFTPLLKNTIDWISRPLLSNPKVSGVTLFQNKPVLIISASPGALGGLRGLRHLRELLTNLGSIVIPSQLALGQAYQQFSEAGELIDASQLKSLTKSIDNLLVMGSKLEKPE